jgi:hypothetical protein
VEGRLKNKEDIIFDSLSLEENESIIEQNLWDLKLQKSQEEQRNIAAENEKLEAEMKE